MWNRTKTLLPDESLREGLSNSDPDIVMDVIMKESGYDIWQLLDRSRKSGVVIARHLACYFLSCNDSLSMCEIGMFFKKNHATALNSRRAIENMIATNREFRLRVIRIAALIINQNNTSNEQR